MADRPPTVLFVEDEMSYLENIPPIFKRRGYRVLALGHPQEVLNLINREDHIDFMVTDLQLPMEGVNDIGLQEAEGGKSTGMVLAREVRRKFPRTPIVFWTISYDQQIRSEIAALGNAYLVSKRSGVAPMFDLVVEALDGIKSGTRPCTFLVHGHDKKTMHSVKEYLQHDLGLPEPIILRDRASHGQTIIEKIESYGHQIDLVFILLTPDDKILSDHDREEVCFRPRQNVVFEMGYFFGVLGRGTGRVILLFRQPIELPSDVGGMISIDITNGIHSADAEIRREISEWV